MKPVNRVVLGAILIGTASLANAQINIALDSAGTWSGLDGNGNWTQSENVWAGGSTTGPLPLPTTLSLQSGNNGTTALATYSDGVGDNLFLDVTFTSAVFDATSDFYSFVGSWVYGGGTGAYAGRAGSGTFASTEWNFAPFPAYSGTVVAGVLTPEPAPYAALGLGVIGLLLRRRKK